MKIRNGFVSNSSTSSFFIYGICLEDDEIKKALKLGEYDENFNEDAEDDSDDMDLYEVIEEKMKDTEGFEWHHPEYYDGWYIGKSWDTIGDDETGKQWKDKIESKLTEIFGEGLEFSSHAEAWRDG